MQPSLPATLGAAVLVLAACGGANTPTPGQTATSGATSGPATAAPASPMATAAATTGVPSAAPRPSGSLPWPSEFAVEMMPGRYFTSPPFEIPLALTIDEPGWHAGHLNPVFIDLQRFDGVEVGSFPTRMLAFGWPENVRAGSGPVPVAGLTPGSALDLLEDRGSLETGERAPVELFGLAGERLDLHSELGNNPVFGTADGDFGVQPELDVRLVALALDEGLLMVAVLAPADALAAAWEQALRILATVELAG